jgi:hypothetical protein
MTEIPKPWEALMSDTYGAPESRCPACKKFVVEGTKHRCPKGRNRDPFVDPTRDSNKQGNP